MTNKTSIYILSLGHHDENWDNEKIYKHVFFLRFSEEIRITMKFHYFSDEVCYYIQPLDNPTSTLPIRRIIV